MRVLLSAAEGFMLSESSRCVYSPGYTRDGFPKTEHECLCEIIRLAEIMLVQEGCQVIAKKYDNQRDANYMFDRAKFASNCDVAIFIGLNSSQNNNAQFTTCLMHQRQSRNTHKLFEAMMASVGRYITLDKSPIGARYPNQLRRIPALDTCNKLEVPAVFLLPWFFTHKFVTPENLGELIESTAKAIVEGVMCYVPEKETGE